MSSIFGVVNVKGKCIDSDQLSKMQASMLNWGSDGTKIWLERQAGLGNLLQHATPESLLDTLPRCCANDRFVITANARLDNRESLFKKLRISVSLKSMMTDSELILQAYEHWGRDTPQHLLGEWAFAIWDRHKQELFLARDHFVPTPLYYYQDAQYFVFSSSIKGILAHPQVPRALNKAALIQTQGNETVYADIYRLTPAQALLVSTSRTECWHYWKPDQAPDVRFCSDSDYVEAFREIYTEAVHCRLRSHYPLATTLSSGLDSGSVASLAARKLAQEGKRLQAFSMIPNFDVSKTASGRRFGDETEGIEATAEFSGNIDVTYVKTQSITPLAAIKRGLFLQGQLSSSWNIQNYLSLLQEVKQQGYGTLLVGFHGNRSISFQGDQKHYLLSLIKRGHWKTYIQEVLGWHSLHSTDFVATLKSQVISPLIPEILHKYKHRGHQNRSSPFNRSALMQRKDNISIKGVPLLQRINQQVFNKGRGFWPELGAEFGIEVRDPTSDKRIVEFCLGLPPEQFMRNGKDKWIFRRAMEGVMPKDVLWNPRRGQQAADIILQVRASQTEIRDALATFQTSPLIQEYLDLPRMNTVFETALRELSPALTHEVGLVLLKGIGIGLFLQKFDTVK